MFQPQKPIVIVFLGSIGSGKSYFARQLAEKTNLVRLNTDAFRKAMGETWGDESNRKLWSTMDYMVEQLLLSRQSIIYDAARFNILKSRQALTSLAEECDASVLIVWVDTPAEVAAERVQTREHATDQVRFSLEETTEIIASHFKTFSPPLDTETYIKLDGLASFDEQYESFQEQLREKGITLGR